MSQPVGRSNALCRGHAGISRPPAYPYSRRSYGYGEGEATEVQSGKNAFSLLEKVLATERKKHKKAIVVERARLETFKLRVGARLADKNAKNEAAARHCDKLANELLLSQEETKRQTRSLKKANKRREQLVKSNDELRGESYGSRGFCANL